MKRVLIFLLCITLLVIAIPAFAIPPPDKCAILIVGNFEWTDAITPLADKGSSIGGPAFVLQASDPTEAYVPVFGDSGDKVFAVFVISAQHSPGLAKPDMFILRTPPIFDLRAITAICGNALGGGTKIFARPIGEGVSQGGADDKRDIVAC